MRDDDGSGIKISWAGALAQITFHTRDSRKLNWPILHVARILLSIFILHENILATRMITKYADNLGGFSKWRINFLINYLALTTNNRKN